MHAQGGPGRRQASATRRETAWGAGGPPVLTGEAASQPSPALLETGEGDEGVQSLPSG